MVSGNDEFARTVGSQLRKTRERHGLSLRDVERRSRGRWSAASIAVWERGERTPQADKLAALADFYGVSVIELLEGTGITTAARTPGRIVIDLVQLRQLDEPDARRLQQFVADIQRRRFDYNGRILSIRSDDLRQLAMIYETTNDDMLQQLQTWNVLWTNTAQ
jgi:transcriptional regulator with XRE-family HTH domain